VLTPEYPRTIPGSVIDGRVTGARLPARALQRVCLKSAGRRVVRRVEIGGAALVVTAVVAIALSLSGVARASDRYRWLGSRPDSSAVYAVAINPASPASVLAGTLGGHVFESRQFGRKWRARSSDLPGFVVLALAFDPNNPRRALAGVLNFGNDPKGVYLTEDGGKTWRPTSLTTESVHGITFDPRSPGVVYAAGSAQPHKSQDGGKTWVQLTAGITSADFRSISIHPADSNVLLAAATGPSGSVGAGGIFKSTNAGLMWVRSDSGIGDKVVETVIFDPDDPTIVYAGTQHEGVYRSLNGGATWQQKNRGLSYAGNVPAMVAFGSPPVLYATGGSSLMRSVNRGESWERFDSGLPAGAVRDLALDQRTASLCAAMDQGVYCRVLQRSAAGEPASSFGVAGVSLLPVGGVGFFPPVRGVVSPDGSVVLGSVFVTESSATAFLVARITSGGQLDSEFGTDGTAVIEVPGFRGGSLGEIAASPDGGFIVAGSVHTDSGSQALVAKLTADGLPDESFASSGVFVLGPERGSSFLSSAAVRTDGSLVVAGVPLIMQLTADGEPDDGFAAGGLFPDDVGETGGWASDVVLQADGRAVVSLRHFTGTEVVAALWRFGKEGDRDESFGVDGAASPASCNDSSGNGLLRLSDDSLASFGQAVGDELCVVRFSMDGVVDEGWAENGQATITGIRSSQDRWITAAEQADGRIVIGTAANGAAALARLTAHGTADASFGTNGLVIWQVPTEIARFPKDFGGGFASFFAGTVGVADDRSITLLGRWIDVGGGTNEQGFGAVRVRGDAVDPADLLILDGFDDSSLTSWTSSVGLSKADISTTASLQGPFGLRVPLDADRYVEHTSAEPSASVHARFLIDPRTAQVAAPSGVRILALINEASSKEVVSVSLRQAGDGYRVRLRSLKRGSSVKQTKWLPVPPAPFALEVAWAAATGAGQPDGRAVIEIDGVERGRLRRLRNDAQLVDVVRLGVSAIKPGDGAGAVSLDQFEARRFTRVGVD
jgi:uncharacterized delta-60 repeat protein